MATRPDIPIDGTAKNLITAADPDLANNTKYLIQNLGPGKVRLHSRAPTGGNADAAVYTGGLMLLPYEDKEMTVETATPPWAYCEGGDRAVVAITES